MSGRSQRGHIFNDDFESKCLLGIAGILYTLWLVIYVRSALLASSVADSEKMLEKIKKGY